MKRIPLHDRRGDVVAEALVDDEDFERFGHLPWSGRDRVRRTISSSTTRSGTTSEELARLILGLSPGDGFEAEHVDRNPLNNQRSNLRAATHAQNHQNKSPTARHGSKSHFRGVRQNSTTGLWFAYATVRGRRHEFRWYKTEEDAARIIARFRHLHMPYTSELPCLLDESVQVTRVQRPRSGDVGRCSRWRVARGLRCTCGKHQS